MAHKYLITEGTVPGIFSSSRIEELQQFFLRKVVLAVNANERRFVLLEDDAAHKLFSHSRLPQNGWSGWVEKWLRVPDNAY